MGKKNTPSQQSQQVNKQAQTAYQSTLTPSPLETQMGGVANQFMGNYNNAVAQNTKDYGNIMGGYQSFMNNLGAPKQFSYQTVHATTPEELKKAYGYLDEAMPGYRMFADSGGYKPGEIQDLRARGIAPIRAAYGNTMMELNRARALGGGGGSPNYIASLTHVNRDLSQGTSDAMEKVNADLAESVRQGREFGLQGISGTGSTMGGLASADAQRQLSASLANQQADLEAQRGTEQAYEFNRQAQLGALGGQTSLYGTTPGMSNMFGNQALGAYGTAAQMQDARNRYGLGLMDAQLRASQTQAQTQGTPWWKKALGAAAAGAATYLTAGAASPWAAGIYGGIAGGAANFLGGSQPKSGMSGIPTNPDGSFAGVGQDIGLPTGDYGYGASQQYWD